MPSHDTSRGPRGGIEINRTLVRLDRRSKRKRRPKGEEPGGVPVEPNRPNTLSGGAAAALEFDE